MRHEKFKYRVGEYVWTRRKIALAQSLGERRRAQEAARLPLLAEQLPEAPRFDLEAETRVRQERADRFTLDQRAFHARMWREARAQFFASPESVKAEIRRRWSAFQGPATAFYFSSIVDVATGEQARRWAVYEEKAAVIRREVRLLLSAQQGLDLG